MRDRFSRDGSERGRGVTAVLGPTNTGKTYLAIERMLGHESGIIGLPLRLLAREVFDKVARAAGAGNVALITGEEKILPKSPRYYVCTVEAMPRDIDTAFLAVDEIQLAADAERGHVFTRHLLHARGYAETLLLGAATMKDAIVDLLPRANIISRPRLSKLSYAGGKKISRLPRRSAIVTFSADEVYAIAEQVRRQRGGAAVVLGALSPKTRNAQVDLYQNGEVDFIVATDAIGMGLNLDVDHVALASVHKFDGREHRELTNAEIGQVAGRAGRHTNDGTFGVTGNVEPFEQARAAALEAHAFEPVKMLQWRNAKLDFSSIARLKESLRAKPDHTRLTRGRMVNDLLALEHAASNEKVAAMAIAPAAISRLWEVCQLPDYRKISAPDHAELVTQLYCHLMSDNELVPEDWFAEQVRHADNTSGDIDTLANRISHIRTWTYVSHRADWLADPAHWQGRTRAIEDKLSDALHERLTQRFVDRRTSVLMKTMRDKENLNAEIGADGAVTVERHFIGTLAGFAFTPDTSAAGVHGKAARHAAAQFLSEELAGRAQRLSEARPEELQLTRLGHIVWQGAQVARLEKGETVLHPSLVILADEHLSAPDRERIEARISQWLKSRIDDQLAPLVQLAGAQDISGLARGIAFQLAENLGVLKRDDVAQDIRQLDQESRGQLRRYGVRFGAFNIFIPVLLKPAVSDLIVLLWALHHGERHGINAGALPEPPRQGLTSVSADARLPEPLYRAAGYHHCGRRVVRIDMLERLADMIRPLVSWRPDKGKTGEENNQNKPMAQTGASEPPEGATGNGGFRVTPDMTSIIGCSGEEFASVLEILGFRRIRKPRAAGSNGAQSAAEPDEIWRPRRKTPRVAARQGQKSKPRAAGGKARNTPKDTAKRAAPARSNRVRKAKPRQTIDPDSPFAALKDLKRELQHRVKDPS